jgi:hypothetical protein
MTIAFRQGHSFGEESMFQRRYFALSPSFHGMTLLAKLLNAHPKAVCVGDTYPSNRYDQTCGCGKKVSDCEFWQAVKRSVRMSSDATTPHLLPLTPKIVGGLSDQIFFRLLPIKILTHFVPKKENHAFVSGFTGFVDTIYKLSAGGRPEVYVDGVKSLSRVRALLAAGETIDGIVHLVRDPVDYAISSTKYGKQGHINLARQAYIWRSQHRDIERLSAHVPSCRIDYEDLCANPDKTLLRIFAFLGLSPMTFDELRCSDNEPWHFLGNSSLFEFDWTLERKGYYVGNFGRRLVERVATWGGRQ